MYTGGILCIFSRTSAGRGHQTTIPGPGRQAAPSPPYEGGGKVPGRQVGSILEPCLQPLPCSLGSWGRGGSGDDTEKGCLLVVSVLNIRERGNTTEHTGLKPPKAQGWWESSTTGAPRRPREQRGALGEGEGPKGVFPALAQEQCHQAAYWLLGLSQAAAQRPLGRYWLQAST